MSKTPIKASLQTIRRLTVTKQHLAGKLPAKPSKEDIVRTIRDLPYVQWDPISIIAPSHLISLWSRLGDFRISDLESLLWKEKKLFQHWTPIASIVLTEDYPLYLSLMRRYPESLAGSWKSHAVQAKKFLAQHPGLRKKMLKELEKGPLLQNQFSDYRREKSPDGWSSGSDVSRMLFHLHMAGDIMVVGHQGNQNLWGLTRDFLPNWASRKELTIEEFENEAVQRAIRGLGTGTPREINYYFPRGRYQNLKGTLARLQKEGKINRINIEGSTNKEERYIHDQDVPLLESSDSVDWQPRMTLLAPFDNLTYGRERTNRLFNFDYFHEQFLPANKRKYGLIVLPILWGDQLIGRIDPRMDKENEKLLVNSVYAEPGTPNGKEVANRIRETIEQLADFLEAEEVVYSNHVPAGWKNALR